jgi:uncharacterized protein (TIGR00369 family)
MPTPLGPSPLPREAVAGLSGLEILRRMIAGELPPPPFAITMDIEGAEADEGRVVFVGRPREAFLNPLGTIHGGWIATILDSAMACAVHSTLEAGRMYTTTSMTVNYVRPLGPSADAVRCEGTVTYRGARLATAEGKLFDARGRLIAHGSETCMIFGGKEG